MIGYGYDGDSLTDNRGLTAADLDADFPDNSVVIQHFSMHSGVCNSRSLQVFGITRDTPTPKGGVILRKPGTTEPAGLLMETEWLLAVSRLPSLNREKGLELFADAQMIYASAGVTTAQEGLSTHRHRTSRRSRSTQLIVDRRSRLSIPHRNLATSFVSSLSQSAVLQSTEGLS